MRCKNTAHENNRPGKREVGKAEEIGGSTVRPPCPVKKLPCTSPGGLLRGFPMVAIKRVSLELVDILVKADSY